MIDVAKWSFSVGHVFNDLCASMWFLFSLPYLTKVVQLNDKTAGYIVLIGQVCDAVATPLIGIESDRKGFICGSKIGQRKSWHLLGTFLTAISFPFIFCSIINKENTFEWYFIVYYAPFVAVFQFAWATVQVTHLSLIPIMVQEGKNSSILNSLRYMFTVLSNITVLVATTLLFKYVSYPYTPTINNETAIKPQFENFNPHDKTSFLYLSIGIVVLGLFFSLIFHIGVSETRTDIRNEEESEKDQLETLSEDTPLLTSREISMSKSDWFREPQFYLINCIYLSTRLIVNISQSYLVLYVTEALSLPKIVGSLASLTMFVSGVFSSILLKKLQEKIGNKFYFLIGLVFCSAYCIMVAFSQSGNPLWRIYLSMVILGVGSTMLMIGSLSLTTDLIGKSCSSSAFVYGCMSFSDKLLCGLAIWLIQYFRHENKIGIYFYRKVQLYFVAICAFFGLLILLIIFPRVIGIRKKNQNIINQNSLSSNVAT